MAFRQLGGPIKIADKDGKFIGIMFVPNEVIEALQKGREAYCYMDAELPVMNFRDPVSPLAAVIHRIAFIRSPMLSDAFFIYGKEPHELTSNPGFAFIPAYGYLMPDKYAP